MQYYSLLMGFIWLFGAAECYTCPAPEYLSHDGVSFTPNTVHIDQGDQGIVQCVVEFYQNNPPQTFMYVNDCKMMGFDHPTWITRIMQTDGPCSHTDSSKLCRTLTMYINGTAEAHSSRVYCCARLGGRVCSPNSTVSVVEAPQPTPTDFAESSTESCIRPPKPTVTSDKGPSPTPTVTPPTAPPDDKVLTDYRDTPDNTDFDDFSGTSSNSAAACALTLLLSLLANSLVALFQ